MSTHQQPDLRKMALARGLADAPQQLTALRDIQEEEQPDGQTAAAEGASGHGSVMPPPSMGPPPPRPRAEPIPVGSWQAYFDEQLEVSLPDRGGRFNVYAAGPVDAPAYVMCIHGAGYTGLTWSLIASELKHKYRVVAPDLRGHGLTRTTNDTDFSSETMAADIRALWAAVRHDAQSRLSGDTTSTPSQGTQDPTGTTAGVTSSSTSTGVAPPRTSTPAPPPPCSSLLVVGHSMGGALGVWAAIGTSSSSSSQPPSSSAPAGAGGQQGSGPAGSGQQGPGSGAPPSAAKIVAADLPGLAGVVVIDVVEGTAIAALPHMGSVIAARPTSFSSPSEAAAWALKSGMARCKDAAAISIPSQVCCTGDPQAPGQSQQQPLDLPAEPSVRVQAAAPYPGGQQQDGSAGAGSSSSSQQGEGGGAVGNSGAGGAGSSSSSSSRWVWRTSLSATQPYWEGWYTGLSDAFLRVPGPKMLLLAGTDRLDKALTIGQMQGKFQLVLLPQAGHAIQEDQAPATASHLASFLSRFRIGEPPMVLPRPPVGTQPVLPVVAGPIHKP